MTRLPALRVLCAALLALALYTSTGAAVGETPWRIDGGQGGAHLGRSLATADVNGDGYGDLIVGAPGFDDLYPGEGRVTVYLGSSTGLSTTPDWTRYGRQRGAHFGSVVASAGDLNGDGYDDVLVGAPAFDRLVAPTKGFFVGPLGGNASHSTDEGRVQLYLGSSAGLASLPQRTVTGIERGERFGTAVAGAGDVNGDGYDDVLVGAPGKTQGLGALFLFAGTSTGMAPLPSWIELGNQVGVGWGGLVAAAGDVDADGFADFLGATPQATACSQLALFRGSAAGPGSRENVNEGIASLGAAGDFDQDGNVEQLFVSDCPSASVRWRRLGGIGGSSLQIQGTPAAVTAGDVNGDGRVDLVAGSPDFANGALHGRVFVYLNRAGQAWTPANAYPVYDGDQAGAGWGSALAAADVDGDGADEIFIAAPDQDAGDGGEGIVEQVSGWYDELPLFQPPYSPAVSGAYLESFATGDFDADGFTDLVSQTGYAGTMSVRYGNAAGLSASADAVLQPPALASHNALFVGMSTGDVNGDGRTDLQVTFNAHFWGHGSYVVDTIRHALYMGSFSGLATTPALTLDGGGDGEAEIVGDVNGDGYDDLYVLYSWSAGSDELYLGSSAGLSATPAQTFPPAWSINSSDLFSGSTRHRAILPGNLDGDAYGDVLGARLQPTSYEPYFDVYLGSSSGLVLQEPWYLAPTVPDACFYCFGALALEDLDRDGLDDLLLEVGGQAMLLGRTASGFGRVRPWWEPVLPPGTSSTFWNNRVLALTDVDGDGLEDLLLEGMHLHRGSASGFERSPSWWGSVDHPVQLLRAAADFDGDGRGELVQGSVTYPTYGLRVYEVFP